MPIFRVFQTKGIPLIRGSVRPSMAEGTLATMLCATLHGYDALVERLPPTQVVTLLGEYFDVLTCAVLEFGGQIFHLAEADMLAGFGVNDSRHAGIHEAVLVARAIQQRFATITASWRQNLSIDAAVGVGIHRGEVAVAEFGPPEHSVRTLVGDAAHIAAQLCWRARAGETLLTSIVYLAHRSFDGDVPAGATPFLHLPKLHLHGRSTPLDAWCTPMVDRLAIPYAAGMERITHH